jgi:hypothetical protein
VLPVILFLSCEVSQNNGVTAVEFGARDWKVPAILSVKALVEPY